MKSEALHVYLCLPAVTLQRNNEALRDIADDMASQGKNALSASVRRCSWVPETDELYITYHDQEWGTPVHDDRTFFEFLVLEGAQAGLSWRTVLAKRENYRKAFDGFDPARVAEYGDGRIEELMGNPGIIRNRLKLNSAIGNARAFLNIQMEFGSFSSYIWAYVDGRPICRHWARFENVPSMSPESDLLSRDLKRRGFRFVGSTIIYSFMQATGLVNDHTVDCFRYAELEGSSL